MNALNDLFLDELSERHDAERRLARSLPKIVKFAVSQCLIDLLELSRKHTIAHLKHLEAVFISIGAHPTGKRSGASIELLRECDTITNEFANSAAIDAGVILAIQKIGHSKLASYTSLREWAVELGFKQAAILLRAILVEEKATGLAFIALARDQCNRTALGDAQGIEHGQGGIHARRRERRATSLHRPHGISSPPFHSTPLPNQIGLIL